MFCVIYTVETTCMSRRTSRLPSKSGYVGKVRISLAPFDIQIFKAIPFKPKKASESLYKFQCHVVWRL